MNQKDLIENLPEISL